MTRTSVNFVECDCCQISYADDNPLAVCIKEYTMPIVFTSTRITGHIGIPTSVFNQRDMDLCPVCVERLMKLWPITKTDDDETYKFKSSQEDA